MHSDYSDGVDVRPFSLNQATLIGRVSRYGMTLKDGIATGALELVEMGWDEKPHTSYVPVHIWGKDGGSEASLIPAGSLVLVQGQVKPKKTGEHWTVVISARELQLLTAATGEEYGTERDPRGSLA